ncbi:MULTISPECIES: DUF6728 family protein [Roseivirga]|uniref:DUF6728 family protein n=1 Tax=Roseivirga TaxID=290180 RepID=UPI002356D0D5|nr:MULTISPECIES: DUF6728 family protein [Roseivirga]WPZ09076.1 DUF6728 family protein [Roseivirga spongicola]|tara:strand:- start:234 stop:458 length:225 start_codon:yes stop_codon:yes gene_type:complete
MSEEKRTEQKGERVKLSAKEAFDFGPVLGYFFRKKDPSHPSNFNLKVMHGINKISIIMFLIALTVMIVRFISRM